MRHLENENRTLESMLNHRTIFGDQLERSKGIEKFCKEPSKYNSIWLNVSRETSLFDLSKISSLEKGICCHFNSFKPILDVTGWKYPKFVFNTHIICFQLVKEMLMSLINNTFVIKFVKKVVWWVLTTLFML